MFSADKIKISAMMAVMAGTAFFTPLTTHAATSESLDFESYAVYEDETVQAKQEVLPVSLDFESYAEYEDDAHQAIGHEKHPLTSVLDFDGYADYEDATN